MEFQVGDDVEVYLDNETVGYAEIVRRLSPDEFVIRWYWTYDDLVNIAGFTEDELKDVGLGKSDVADTDTETTASLSTIIGKVQLPAPKLLYDENTQELWTVESKQEEELESEEEEEEELEQQ